METKAEAQASRDELLVRLPNPLTWLQDAMPEDFKTHMRAAQREQLLAMRSLIDAALERIDQREKGGSAGRRRVEIAVE
jgi:hypothetical protein